MKQKFLEKQNRSEFITSFPTLKENNNKGLFITNKNNDMYSWMSNKEKKRKNKLES